ncbi:uncharacterized protein LOC106458379 [Limulus polyphemus]|uniref:Uncharacterized protein LOC106458379 n=1 Tax=Limulus polyphemus TaxID=6850 RepID=A0ABM1S9G9_LIMPO|nr:uncharacterized protein LOC106458379 [Limulus polyphemus]
MMMDDAHSPVVTTNSGKSVFIVNDGALATSAPLFTPQSSCDDVSDANQDLSQSTSSEQGDMILDSHHEHEQTSSAKVHLISSETSFIADKPSPKISVERRTVLSSYRCSSSIVEPQVSDISGYGIEKPCNSPNSAFFLQKDVEPSDLSHVSHNTPAKERLLNHTDVERKIPLSLTVSSNNTVSHSRHEKDLSNTASLQLSDSHIILSSNRVISRHNQLLTQDTSNLSNFQSHGSQEAPEVIEEPSSTYSGSSKLQRLPPVSTIIQPRFASLVKKGYKPPSLESSSIDLSHTHDPHHAEALCLSTVSRSEADVIMNPISLVANKNDTGGHYFGDSVDSLQSLSTSFSEADVVESAATSRVPSHSAPVIMSLPDFSKIHSGNVLITSSKDHGLHVPSSVNRFPRMDHRGPLLFDDDGHPIVLPSTNPLLTPLDLGTTTLSMVSSRMSSQTAGREVGQMNMSSSSTRLAFCRPILGVPTGVITAVGPSHSTPISASDEIQEHRPPSLLSQEENVSISASSPKYGSVIEGRDFSGVLGKSESEDDETDDISDAPSITIASPMHGISTSALPSILSSLASQSSYLLSSLVSSTASSCPLTLTKTASSNSTTTTSVPLIHGMQPGLTSSHLPYVSPFLLSGILPTSLSGTSVKQEPQEATSSPTITSASSPHYSSFPTLPSLISILKQEAPTGSTTGSGPLPPFTVVSGLSSVSKRALAGFDSEQVNFHLGEVSVKEEPSGNAETSPSESLSAPESPVLQNTSKLHELSGLPTIPLAVISTSARVEHSSPSITQATTVPSNQITACYSRTATATSKTNSTSAIGMASTSLIGAISGRKVEIVDKKCCQLCKAGKPCSLHSAQSHSVSSQLVSGPLLSGDPAKPFQCNLCGKKLASKNVYQLHMRSHSGEKPFTCNLCGHHFSQKTSLTRHMRSHTGERPFPCEVCGKRFADKERTKIHMRTHTGEKPFACEICGKCFSQKSTVKRHMSVHTGEKPFTCETCGKGFANRGNLNAHSKTHVNSLNT